MNRSYLLSALLGVLFAAGLIILMDVTISQSSNYEESWECVEWGSGAGTASIHELYMIKNFIAVELVRCNYTYDCLWEIGFIKNGSSVSLNHYPNTNEWHWETYVLNETNMWKKEIIESVDLTDDNCTKQIKVRVKHESQ